jgi:hypothetical protein
MMRTQVPCGIGPYPPTACAWADATWEDVCHDDDSTGRAANTTRLLRREFNLEWTTLPWNVIGTIVLASQIRRSWLVYLSMNNTFASAESTQTRWASRS